MDMSHPESHWQADKPLIDLTQLISRLWKRLWLIALCGLIALCLAIAYLSVTPRSFVANGVILLDPREAQTTRSTNVIGGLGSDSAAIASQVAIITSNDALKKVFNDLNLINDPEFTRPGLISKLIRTVIPAKPDSAAREEGAFKSFRKRLFVQREGLTYVINVQFTSEDREKAARIANAIINSYVTAQVDEKSLANTEVSRKLDDQITKLRGLVSRSEKKVEDFKTRNNILDIGVGKTLLGMQIEQLNNMWLKAREDARIAANRYELAKSIGTAPDGLNRLTKFLPSRSAEQLRNNYNSRTARLASISASLKPQHPVRASLEAELGNLRNLMQREATRIVEELKANKELAEAHVHTVEKELKNYREQSDKAQHKAVELRQLERSANATRKVLEEFLQRSRETSQLGALQRPDARIVSKATPPLKPSWPRPVLTMGASGFLGLAIGCMLALFTNVGSRATMDHLLRREDKNKALKPLTSPASEAETPTEPEQQTTPAPLPGDIEQEPPGQLFFVHRWQEVTGEPESIRTYLQSAADELINRPGERFATEIRCLAFDMIEKIPLSDQKLIALVTASETPLDAAWIARALGADLGQMGLNTLIIYPTFFERTIGESAESFITARDKSFDQLIDPATGYGEVTYNQQSGGKTQVFVDQLIRKVTASKNSQIDVILIVEAPQTNTGKAQTLKNLATGQLQVFSQQKNNQAASTEIVFNRFNSSQTSRVAIIDQTSNDSAFAHLREKFAARPKPEERPEDKAD